MSDEPSLTRRSVLKAGAAAAATVAARSVPLSAFTLPPGGPRTLTRDQYALVDELTEILIPADEHSGGARAAGVAAYVDATLTEAFDKTVPTTFIAGLGAIDALAQQHHSRRFLDVSADQKEAIVSAMAAEESDPKTEAAKFFVALKQMTVRGYYTSKLGIHDEMNYLGNTLQVEYSGIDVSK